MKNFKKVLALVLVVASLFGLAATASATTSEDYSDATSISHTEAVDVMSTIGVFDGISGAFSGSSILTREQAAKIITYMVLGQKEADALPKPTTAPYTDVASDRWSAPCIAYCKSEGILAGVGYGRFEPDGKLTGVAFAKMCLVALGYDPKVEELTGPQWSAKTSALAIASAGITRDLTQASLAAEMTREDACQMAFNTIKADLVDYADRGMNVTVNNGSGNNVTISGTPSKAKPITMSTSLVDVRNVIGNIQDERESGKEGVLQFGERYFPNLRQTADAVDAFGRPSVTWTYKSDDIGTYVESDKLIKSWTSKAPKGEMYDAIGSSIVNKMKTDKAWPYTVLEDGKEIKGEDALFVWVDGVQLNAKTTLAKDDYFSKNSSAGAGHAMYKKNFNKVTSENIGMSGNGVLTELYMDDESNVTVVMINTYLVQATADYNTTNERVNVEPLSIDDDKKQTTSFLPITISKDDADVTGVKDEDYLLLTVAFDNNEWGGKDYSIESVIPATLQTATVTEYTDHDDVTMGGTKYSYNKILGDEETGETFAINSDATLVLDTYGYIMYVDEAVSNSNFVYIDNFGSTSTITKKPVADAYFADGTNNEVSVSRVDGVDSRGTLATTYSSKIGGNGKNLSEAKAHQYTHWYTFSGSSSGDYTLNTTNGKRYSKPYWALGVDNVSADNAKFIKSGNVRFINTKYLGNTWTEEVVEGKTTLVNVSEYSKQENADKTKSYYGMEAANVRGNEKTVFVVKDQNGDVASYTGIANVPDVTLSENAAANQYAKISWINRGDYARFVFIDVSEVDGAFVDEVTNVADYMFTLKCTGNETHVEGLTYYKYKVIIDGKEEERWISSAIVTNDTTEDVGRLFYNIKEDSNGRIKDGSEVGTKGKSRQYAAMMNWTEDTIDQSGNSLEITALKDVGGKNGTGLMPDIGGRDNMSDLIAKSSSQINLVVGPKVDDLLRDDGADYETHMGVSANFVSSFLHNYKLRGHVYVVVDDDEQSEVIDALWIYVDGIDGNGAIKQGKDSTRVEGISIVPKDGNRNNSDVVDKDVIGTISTATKAIEIAVVDTSDAAPNRDQYATSGIWNLKAGNVVYIRNGRSDAYIHKQLLEERLKSAFGNKVDLQSDGSVYHFEVTADMKGDTQKTASFVSADSNDLADGGIFTSTSDNQGKVLSITVDGKVASRVELTEGATSTTMTVSTNAAYLIKADTKYVEATSTDELFKPANGNLQIENVSEDMYLQTAFEVTPAEELKYTGGTLKKGVTYYVDADLKAKVDEINKPK